MKINCIFLLILVIISVSTISASADTNSKKINVDNTISQKAVDNTISQKAVYSNLDFTDKIRKFFSPDKNWIEVNSTSQLKTWVKKSEYSKNPTVAYSQVIYKLDPKKQVTEFKSDLKSVVIYPIFTDSAYSEMGFYSYYNKKCDTKCLEVQIQNNFMPQANSSTIQVLNELGYPIITDIDVDKNPSILKNYNKVIVLHNEYVTKNEFQAITNHPNVLYLFPNALYAEVQPNYAKNTIKLVRGHSYPKQEISNGFDWKFDNSKYEKDVGCKDMKFYKISNGWMLNCYPHNKVAKSVTLLKAIKNLNAS